ncbi:MAG: AAA family ATPase [bacterium]
MNGIGNPAAGKKKLSMMPTDIYREISKDIIGQDGVLRFVSVAIFKHVLGEKFGNLLMIGNSGTGKTSIMQSMERMYNRLPFFEKHRVVVRLNANTLADEDEGVVKGRRLFRLLDEKARSVIGTGEVTAEKIREYMEHATVCIDEIDKITSRVGDKANVLGIAIQQSLLTIMEGEEMLYDTHVMKNGELKPVTIPINTAGILFICGGAFEALYDQVYSRVFREGKQDKLTKMVMDDDRNVHFVQIFTLRDNLQQEDLFIYGMQPQFLSRFDNAVVLNDLTADNLETIFTEPENSVVKTSQRFFKNYNVVLEITGRAKRLIALEAAKHSRVGARALKEVFGRVIKPFEFDPFSREEVRKHDDGHELLIDEDIVRKALDLK